MLTTLTTPLGALTMLQAVTRAKQSLFALSEGEFYLLMAKILGVPVFLAAWVYAIVTHGFFLGVGLGWIPALVVGFIAGLLWPFVLIIGGILLPRIL